ncbi:MAG: HAD family hydrolase [Deltaproteobacteria bacterium]|nr:HAD family hydrolase [Deltaproteobacteria bacterium]
MSSGNHAPQIKAITFDIWDTLFIDESDAPKRHVAGLDPKPQMRRRLVWEALGKAGDEVDRRLVDVASDAVDAAARKVWHELFVTWTVPDRIDLILMGLGRDLPGQERESLANAFQSMEMEIGVDAVAGAKMVLEALSKQYQLAVISDTIFSPGWALRKMLDAHGLDEYFDARIFSDELGHSKPHPDVFWAAAGALGVRPDELVHIGDREHNDVAGIHAVGGRAVLVTAVKDRGSHDTKAEAVCERLENLPGIIETMAGQ